jgi:hypothetical protein
MDRLYLPLSFSLVSSSDIAMSLSSLKVVDLRARCKEAGLPTGGRKSELVERLEDHMRKEAGASNDNKSAPPSAPDSQEVPPRPAANPLNFWILLGAVVALVAVMFAVYAAPTASDSEKQALRRAAGTSRVHQSVYVCMCVCVCVHETMYYAYASYIYIYIYIYICLSVCLCV